MSTRAPIPKREKAQLIERDNENYYNNEDYIYGFENFFIIIF
jgi:hypothetical protein